MTKGPFPSRDHSGQVIEESTGSVSSPSNLAISPMDMAINAKTVTWPSGMEGNVRGVRAKSFLVRKGVGVADKVTNKIPD